MPGRQFRLGAKACLTTLLVRLPDQLLGAVLVIGTLLGVGVACALSAALSALFGSPLA